MSRSRVVENKLQKNTIQTRNKNGYIQNSRRKPDEDVEKEQISELLEKLPKLDSLFEVHRKIGEGTFSSVYLGSLRQHSHLPESQKKWFAIKHLVPNAHPARIEHELRCLRDIGGKNNVIGVDLCLRHMDTIVFIMPYIPHRKFSEYVGEMEAEELRQYLKALLEALQHVHSFGVIHRDIKPSNFLYDRENRRYQLVDFGLAQRVVPREPPPAHQHNKRLRPLHEDVSSPGSKRVALDLSLGRPIPVPAPSEPPPPADAKKRAGVCGAGVAAGAGGCACAGAGGVCARCLARVAPRAPRAGTQGFRPPEVLLKVTSQTCAVDMWACGVVALCVACARYPLLAAGDDVAALAELTALCGAGPMRRAARALHRVLLPSRKHPGLCLRRLACRLRGAPPPPPPAPPCRACVPPADCLCAPPYHQACTFTDAWVCGFPDSLFALLARLLDPDPRTRITAARALQHPFITTVHPAPISPPHNKQV